MVDEVSVGENDRRMGRQMGGYVHTCVHNVWHRKYIFHLKTLLMYSKTKAQPLPI
jgi:hypothetical protein